MQVVYTKDTTRRIKQNSIFRAKAFRQASDVLSTRTAAGSKLRRYRWRMMASAVLVWINNGSQSTFTFIISNKNGWRHHSPSITTQLTSGCSPCWQKRHLLKLSTNLSPRTSRRRPYAGNAQFCFIVSGIVKQPAMFVWFYHKCPTLFISSSLTTVDEQKVGSAKGLAWKYRSSVCLSRSRFFFGLSLSHHMHMHMQNQDKI